MSAHLYYDLDSPVLSDAEFDALCKDVADAWDDLGNVRQVMLGGDPEALRASASHCLLSRMTFDAAWSWHIEMIGWEPDHKKVFRGEMVKAAGIFLHRVGG